jgi:hypothetical protein
MAPTAKNTRSGVKGHVTRIINFIRAYQSTPMTERASSELTEQEKRLREKFESFKTLTLQVQEDMVTEEATDQELQAEIDYVAATEEEVSDAKVIMDYKQK